MDVSSSINPYGQARVALGLSKAALARMIPCSDSAVLYNEQGLYVSPLSVITEFLVEKEFDGEVLRRGYYAFQRATRRQNARMWLLPPVDRTIDPLRAAVKHNNYTPTGFCKKFCLQPILLQKPQTMGPLVEKVFLAAGFTPVQVEELKERLQEHIEYGLYGPRLENSELY